MNLLKLTALFVILLSLLNGCAAAAIGGSTYAVKASKRGDLLPAAEAGDAEAQYRFGLSWCCMGPGFDTQVATEWLCRAAAQQHPLARFELGRIFAGDVSRTPAPGQKVLRLATARENWLHSAYWFSLAAGQGVSGAAEKRDEAIESLNSGEREQLQFWLTDQEPVACEYKEIFPE